MFDLSKLVDSKLTTTGIIVTTASFFIWASGVYYKEIEPRKLLLDELVERVDDLEKDNKTLRAIIRKSLKRHKAQEFEQNIMIGQLQLRVAEG